MFIPRVFLCAFESSESDVSMLIQSSFSMEVFSGQFQTLSQETSTWDRWFQELDQLHRITIHHFGLRSTMIDLRRPVAEREIDQHVG